MKKSLLMFVLALLVAAPLSAFDTNVAQAGAPLSANIAVRGESAVTVYWYANDGKRYVFPNAAAYFTWFPSWDSVRTITDADLISIPLGGNATYRPGAKLVKINTDPRTYAVAKGGVLRHVTSESLASQLYGADWRSDIHDIPDTYFTNYTVGAPIYNESDYNVSNEYHGVSTPSDSLRATTNGTSGTLSIWTDKTSINSGDAITVSAWSSDTFNVSRIEVYDERDNNLVFTCYSVQNCSQSRTFFRRNTSENTFRLYAQLKDWNGTVLRTTYSPTVTFNGTNQMGTLTLTADRTSITGGQTVTLTAQYGSDLPTNSYLVIRAAGYTGMNPSSQSGYGLTTCYTRFCTITVNPYVNTSYQAHIVQNGSITAQSSQVSVYVDGSGSSNDGVNYINGLVLNADRTSINPGNVVRLTADAFKSGTWSYTGNRIDIVDAHRGTIVRTCYDVSTCVADVYPQAQSATNLTAQYQARIYDRNGVFAMSQYSPVIYLTSYNGSNGNSTIGTGTITFAPTDALHPNRNVYLTSTFTGSNIPLYDAQVRIYTEQSSTPIATCNAGYTCSVSYPTGSSPMTTRIYGQLSNRFSVGTYAETPRVNLTTTW